MSFFPGIEQAKEKLWDTWGASLQQPSKTWSSSVEDYHWWTESWARASWSFKKMEFSNHIDT